MELESIFTQDQIARREYQQREKAIMAYSSNMNAATRERMLREKIEGEIIQKISGFSVEQIEKIRQKILSDG